jgi:hypothetical protein
MIEIRRCARTGRCVMIEANPRFWGPFQFTLDQGVDLLTPFFSEYGLTALLVAPFPRHSHYFWSGGLSCADVPPAYHNYSAERFCAERTLVTASDLFNRADTLRLYEQESAQAKSV